MVAGVVASSGEGVTEAGDTHSMGLLSNDHDAKGDAWTHTVPMVLPPASTHRLRTSSVSGLDYAFAAGEDEVDYEECVALCVCVCVCVCV